MWIADEVGVTVEQRELGLGSLAYLAQTLLGNLRDPSRLERWPFFILDQEEWVPLEFACPLGGSHTLLSRGICVPEHVLRFGLQAVF